MLRALPGVRCLMPDTENEQQPIALRPSTTCLIRGMQLWVGNPYV